MIKELNFDMDGTIADLYGCDGWLDDIINESVRPYAEAKPLLNLNSLARVLNRKIAEGYKVNIISWTAKNGTEAYNKAVAEAKKVWLAKHLKSVKFNEIRILPYGTPKHEHGNGVLFDDEKPNRDKWIGVAFDEKNIVQVLKQI